MKKSKKNIILLLIVSLIIYMTGCVGKMTASESNDLTIKMVVKKSNHEFWEVVNMGAQAAAKEFNVIVDFEGPTDEEDIDGQIRMVAAAIEEKADAIVLAASDYERLVDVAEKAVLEGIPVIIIDSNINSDKMVSFVGTDNIDAGILLGTTLVESIGEKGKIAVINFVKGAATASEREKGLRSVIDQYPNINVVETLYCNSDELLAKSQTIDIINTYGAVDAIVCLNAYATVGAARAIDSISLLRPVKIIGFDIVPEEVSFLEKGVIESLVIQNPFNMETTEKDHVLQFGNWSFYYV
ncbi:MAG: substrate-binding domain-containing protein [Clostridia bacterium]|nr:substrate-binding domain-containing protein [Clostridia bacterium]